MSQRRPQPAPPRLWETAVAWSAVFPYSFPPPEGPRCAIPRPCAAVIARLMNDRIVITGIGMVTSVGRDRESTWRAVQAGHNGVRRLCGLPGIPDNLLLGATVVLQGDLEPESILRTMARERITSAMAVPTLLHRLVSLPPEIYFIDSLPVIVDVKDVLVVGILAIVISFIATIYPARRAAKLYPVEILRYE